MQTDNRLFDDLARVATNAIGSLQTARDEASNRIKQQFERIVETMDLVSREEFDTVKAMAQKARLENDKLAKRVVELEAKLGLSSDSTQKAAATKKVPPKAAKSKSSSGRTKTAKSKTTKSATAATRR